jgi:WD40 repeat protein
MRKLELLKSEIKDERIIFDIDYYKRYYRLLKKYGKSKINLKNLFELQNFEADFDQIWSAKFSNDNKYLAIGGKSKVLKIFEINDFVQNIDNTIKEYFKLIDETCIRIYTEHSSDIIDLSWSYKKDILFTASLDNTVIMWDINELSSIKIYKHKAMVVSICLHPNV